MTEYDPATCITALELRRLGAPVPDNIPDCAWVPRSAWHVEPDAVQPEGSPHDILIMSFSTTFTEPFRWVEASFLIPKP